MTTLTIQLPDNDPEIILAISNIVKNVRGCRIDIDSDDDGFTEGELADLKTSLKEAVMIKNDELKPLSMNDLWDE